LDHEVIAERLDGTLCGQLRTLTFEELRLHIAGSGDVSMRPENIRHLESRA
jgi:hypothetical protein